jgi:UDP-N-acetyl-D-glucosamine dehydrogenase
VNKDLGNVASGHLDMEALERTFGSIGERARARALIIVETSMALGTTGQITFAMVKRAHEERGMPTDPLLAPTTSGSSRARGMWRRYAVPGASAAESATTQRTAVRFSSQVISVAEYALSALERAIESETARIVRNGYRASLVWRRLCKRGGVEVFGAELTACPRRLLCHLRFSPANLRWRPWKLRLISSRE